jgi:hypothetical protein
MTEGTVLPHVKVILDRLLDWILGLLTTYMHDS